MTRDGFVHLFNLYRQVLDKRGVQPKQVDAEQQLWQDELLAHCRWMIEHDITSCPDSIAGFETAMRFTGCIRGVLVAHGTSL